MIAEKTPVFVCQCCGNIIRSIAYEEEDVYSCRICGTEMKKTHILLSDSEYNSIFSDNNATFEFKSRIFTAYVQDNELYDNKMHKKRLEQEIKSFNKWMYGE